MLIKTLKVRVKDKHIEQLNRKAQSVNFVWNYINDLSSRSIKERGNFLSGFDLCKYTKGVNKDLGLHSHTVQMVGAEYATRRKQFKKSKLAWRKSKGSRRSLGWIPISIGIQSGKTDKYIITAVTIVFGIATIFHSTHLDQRASTKMPVVDGTST